MGINGEPRPEGVVAYPLDHPALVMDARGICEVYS
jgi:hypothetical protein